VSFDIVVGGIVGRIVDNLVTSKETSRVKDYK
jgi:hypothetical protein